MDQGVRRVLAVLCGALLSGALLSPAAADSVSPCASPPAPIVAGSIVKVGQSKSWQPRGGEIEFNIAATQTLPADARVAACVRWRHVQRPLDEFAFDAPVRIIQRQANGSLDIAVTIPHMPGSPPHTTWGLSEAARANAAVGEYVAFGMVPVADVRLLVIDKDGKALIDAVSGIGVTSRWRAAVVAVVVVLVALGLLSLVKLPRGTRLAALRTGALLRLISTGRGYASLSQTQIVLWTLLVGASACYVMTLSGELIEITSGTLVLLGISGAATLGSKFQSDREDAAISPPAVTSPPASSHVPHWSDLVRSGTEIDVTRVQMIFFTLIIAAFVAMKVATSYAIPEIPDNFLVLMGISNGVYMGSKYSRTVAGARSPTTAASNSSGGSVIGAPDCDRVGVNGEGI
jgi:hypothetical protein